MSIEDEIARMRSQGDQAQAGSEELAGSIGAFYKRLVDQGMFAEHALQVTMHWMALMMEAEERDE